MVETYAFKSGFGGQAGFGIVLAADGRCRHSSQHFLYTIPIACRFKGFQAWCCWRISFSLGESGDI